MDAAFANVEAQESVLRIARERSLSRLLTTYIVTGLFFMLFPGTLIGVCNLLMISTSRSADAVSPSWIQAHGQAQIFGWIGSFILGIGFYSLPKLRRLPFFRISDGWVCWTMWTAGVLLHWITGVYDWNWRILLPISALLQLGAFLIFFRAVAGHKPPQRSSGGFESWVMVVIGGTLGLLLALLLNLGGSIYMGLFADSPALPHVFDQRFVTVATGGFLVPFVWGFSARWLPVFLGLRPVHPRLLLATLAANGIGIMICLLGGIRAGSPFLVMGAVCAVLALRLYEPTVRPPKVRGVHASFPLFIRIAYAWLLTAAFLGLWAASQDLAPGIWGASRHALTVGFLSTMVFSIGSRVLPAFSGMRLLFSTRLMFMSLALLTGGCLLRVTAEVIAYQGYGAQAWSWLPVSAVTELVAVMIFGINMGCTFVRKPVVPVADAAGPGLPQR